MRFNYYRILINPFRDRYGPLNTDDAIYLKSLSPIQILPDESRVFTDPNRTNTLALERIRAEQYKKEEERIKKAFNYQFK